MQTRQGVCPPFTALLISLYLSSLLSPRTSWETQPQSQRWPRSEGREALLPREGNLILPHWLGAGTELQSEEQKSSVLALPRDSHGAAADPRPTVSSNGGLQDRARVQASCLRAGTSGPAEDPGTDSSPRESAPPSGTRATMKGCEVTGQERLCSKVSSALLAWWGF